MIVGVDDVQKEAAGENVHRGRWVTSESTTGGPAAVARPATAAGIESPGGGTENESCTL